MGRERVKVTTKVSVYIEADAGTSLDALKDQWRKNVSEGRYKTGNFNVKALEGEEDE